MDKARELLSKAKFYEGYSRYLEDEGRYETWEEAVGRVMDMHRSFYSDKMSPELEKKIDRAEQLYKDSRVLGAQRALQFGGDQLLKHQMRLYNCTSLYIDRVASFGESMYMLLCGAGVGFSVQKHHVEELPSVAPRTKPAKTFTVPDSIEGWADAFSVLLSSYFTEEQTFPEYAGKRVHFDLNEIRPRGSYISGGFRAPGSEPLRQALDKVEYLLEQIVREGETKLRPIHVYDVVMYMADAVLAGGVRRSATICMFSIDDQEMIEAKTRKNFDILNDVNTQRARSNNSAICVRGETTKEQFDNLMQSVKELGEPGFIWTDSKDFCFNPCVEIGMFPKTEDGRSGIQGCNLCDINGAECTTPERFFEACEAASILATLQAGYTDFRYLSKEAKEIFDREALIGVSVTGWMNNPDVLLHDGDVMASGAHIVKKTNKEVADMIDINPAARTTCVKPAGNSSVLLGTASGIHPEHAPAYFRNVQMSKGGAVEELIKKANPQMVEDSQWSSTGNDSIIAFPVESPEGSMFKDDMQGVKHLRWVERVQKIWVEEGTNPHLCTDDRLRHNVSNTIVVDDWDAVGDYIYENQKWFAGVSLIPDTGDKDFPQAPFTAVHDPQDLVLKYGDASMFASGLIVEGEEAFGDLWSACSTALGYGEEMGELSHSNLTKHDFIRRIGKFADNYFAGDMVTATYCLKDVYNLHKWSKIKRNMTDIGWYKELTQQEYTDADTLGAAACAGGACDVSL